MINFLYIWQTPLKTRGSTPHLNGAKKEAERDSTNWTLHEASEAAGLLEP